MTYKEATDHKRDENKLIASPKLLDDLFSDKLDFSLLFVLLARACTNTVPMRVHF